MMAVNFRLDGKVAVVTGGARGNGRAIALALASAGAKVVIADIDETGAEQAAAEIRDAGGDAFGMHADVTKRASVEALRASAVERYGAVHILVNNAGIMRHADFFEFSDQDWDDVMDVNLRGPFLCSQIIGRAIADAGGGCILNITSNAAETGGARIVSYGASKGGLRAMTRGLATELAKYNIRVNDLSPGFVETDLTRAALQNPDVRATRESMIPLGRISDPDDLAGAALFLCSDAAAYVTGARLVVDGGLSNQTLPRKR